MTNSRLSVVVGGQLGSEGKGAITAYLARPGNNVADHHTGARRRVICVRVAGPNAGHTVLGKCPPECADAASHGPDTVLGIPWGHPWRLRQVPVAAVSNRDAVLLIAAGSEIDPLVLGAEVASLDAAGYDVSGRLMIDGSATLIEPRHRDAEWRMGLVDRIGSTGKGIGAARIDRLARVASLWKDGGGSELWDLTRFDTGRWLTEQLVDASGAEVAHVIIEGTQGFGLGLHTLHYPQVTSSDCRAIDFLAMAGVSPWALAPNNGSVGSQGSPFEVWVVLRTYPIRVAGNSGELKGETNWQDLGLPEERTTVTNKVRRVGAWDPDLARAAVEANGGHRNPQTGSYAPPVRVALTMADYLVPQVAGRTNADYDELPDKVRSRMFRQLLNVTEDVGVFPTLVGTGPDTILDLRPEGPAWPKAFNGTTAAQTEPERAGL